MCCRWHRATPTGPTLFFPGHREEPFTLLIWEWNSRNCVNYLNLFWTVQFTKSSDLKRQHRLSSQSHDSKRSGLGIAGLDTCLLKIKDQHSNRWGNQSHMVRGFEPRGRWYALVAKHIAAGGSLQILLRLVPIVISVICLENIPNSKLFLPSPLPTSQHSQLDS